MRTVATTSSKLTTPAAPGVIPRKSRIETPAAITSNTNPASCMEAPPSWIKEGLEIGDPPPPPGSSRVPWVLDPYRRDRTACEKQAGDGPQGGAKGAHRGVLENGSQGRLLGGQRLRNRRLERSSARMFQKRGGRTREGV